MSKGKKALVTGAAGFIGFHTAKRMLDEGWTVVGVDNLTPYYDPRMKEKRIGALSSSKGFKLYRESIADHHAVERIFISEKPDVVIHLAAQAGVRYSLKNPWAYGDSNYQGTLNVFEAARMNGISKIIYASSSSVYGDNTEMPFKESHPTDHPISLYAASKKANEVLAYAYHSQSGKKMSMIGLRFFTVYGEYGRPDLALFRFVKNMLSDKEIALFNNGEMTRNFTYIDDIVDGIMSVVGKADMGCEIYNLGGPEEITLKRFVELIEKNLGIKARVKYMPMQTGDVPATAADISKASHDLGFEPKVGVEEGITRFVDWFKENKSWLLELKEPE